MLVMWMTQIDSNPEPVTKTEWPKLINGRTISEQIQSNKRRRNKNKAYSALSPFMPGGSEGGAETTVGGGGGGGGGGE